MTWILTVVVIVEGIAIYALWSRLKDESARITALTQAVWPESAEIDQIDKRRALGLDPVPQTLASALANLRGGLDKKHD